MSQGFNRSQAHKGIRSSPTLFSKALSHLDIFRWPRLYADDLADEFTG